MPRQVAATNTKSILDQTMPAKRAAALRIGVGAVWLFELYRLWPWQADLYETGVWGQDAVFVVWIAATIALLAGFRPRLAAAVSSLCFFVFVNLGREIYHIDYYAQISTAYLIIINSGSAWSVDSLLRRRAGRPPVSSVWALPILALLIHLALTYFDAAGSHLFLNDYWEEGTAVGRSWNHAQFGNGLSAMLGSSAILGRIANWGTLLVEGSIVFLVVLYARDWRRQQRLGLTIAGSLLLLHVSIVLTYSIGSFGLFMVALVSPYLPWERLSQAEPVLASESVGRSNLVAGLLGVVLTMALLTAVPLRPYVDGLGLERARSLFSNALDLVGDHRPHDVFNDRALTYAFTFDIKDDQGNNLGLLFDANGRRLGVMTYMRTFMVWQRVGQDAAEQLDIAGSVAPLDRITFESVVAPVLSRATASGTLRPSVSYQIWFQGWTVGTDEPIEQRLAEPQPWIEFEVESTGVNLVGAFPMKAESGP